MHSIATMGSNAQSSLKQGSPVAQVREVDVQAAQLLRLAAATPLWSRSGAHQGDPCRLPVFALTIQQVLESVQSWHPQVRIIANLDDVILQGPKDAAFFEALMDLQDLAACTVLIVATCWTGHCMMLSSLHQPQRGVELQWLLVSQSKQVRMTSIERMLKVVHEFPTFAPLAIELYCVRSLCFSQSSYMVTKGLMQYSC
jgi:hypothetical protein